jgi:hypothetical protein
MSCYILRHLQDRGTLTVHPASILTMQMEKLALLKMRCIRHLPARQTNTMSLRDNVYAFQFRSEPVSQTLTPFLTAFAIAASQMQKLKAFELWAPIEWELQDHFEWDWDLSAIAAGTRDELLAPSLAWGIAYANRGVRPFSSNLGEIAPVAKQLWWRTADWRPRQDLRCLFQQIGSDRGDEPVVEHFDPGSRLREQGRCDFEAASQASNGLLDTPV